MKKLYLSSSFKDIVSIFSKEEGNIEGKTVTFIPTASVVEKVNFFVKSGKKALESLGLVVHELEVSTKTKEECIDTINKNDYIYITGGNTFFLLQELKKKDLLDIIKNAVLNGKIYIGESAGSIITSSDILYVEKMDSTKKAPDLTEYSGLGLTEFYVIPHQNNFPFKKQVEKIISLYQDKLNLKPIGNNQLIKIHQDTVNILE